MRSLSRLLAPERIAWLAGESRNEILRELAEVHCRLDPVVPLDQVLGALIEREELGSTAIGLGLALPHARIEKLRAFSLVLGVHPSGVDFVAFDDHPVRIFSLILGPSSEDDLYVRILGRTSRFLRDNRDAILAAATPDAIYALTLQY